MAGQLLLLLLLPGGQAEGGAEGRLEVTVVSYGGELELLLRGGGPSLARDLLLGEVGAPVLAPPSR